MTVVGPDVSVLSAEIAARTNEDEYVDGPPLVAIEIISPSESAGKIRAKTQKYLKHGAKEVWLIYPEFRQLDVISKGKYRQFEREQLFENDAFSPAIEIAVRRMFGD